MAEINQNSEMSTKRIIIKFLFKNEVEHSYVLTVALDQIEKIQNCLIEGAKKDWMLIPDYQEKGRFCLIKTDELVCIQTSN